MYEFIVPARPYSHTHEMGVDGFVQDDNLIFSPKNTQGIVQDVAFVLGHPNFSFARRSDTNMKS